jgi:hypothetical protein
MAAGNGCDVQYLLFLLDRLKSFFGRLAADVRGHPAPKDDDEGDDF